jgi:hypothetical protein
MEYKEAVTILMVLLNRHSLNTKEKEAVLTAIGLLDWAAIGKKRMKSIMKARKDKRDKDAEW